MFFCETGTLSAHTVSGEFAVWVRVCVCERVTRVSWVMFTSVFECVRDNSASDDMGQRGCVSGALEKGIANNKTGEKLEAFYVLPDATLLWCEVFGGEGVLDWKEDREGGLRGLVI